MSDEYIKELLEEKYDLYNRPSFIESDPIQIPHQYSDKRNIEIAAFLTSAIAWGQRKIIIRDAKQLLNLMDNNPYQFITGAKPKDFARFDNYVHRTFNGTDCRFFIQSLQNIYLKHGGLRQLFENQVKNTGSVKDAIAHFRKIFFEINHPERTRKHIADVTKKSAAKRINMFLMWMVRNDNRGVHFGLWNKIHPKQLYLPLDVHTGNITRQLGLLKRKQNDWSAVEEVTRILRLFDAEDPIKYDFALFGMDIYNPDELPG